MDVDWNAAAVAWDRYRDVVEDLSAEVTDALLAAVRPLTGRQVLELGAGTGELAARLADEIGPTGSLMVTDVAAAMVELQTRRLATYPHVEHAVVDAMTIDLPADSFDVVVFRMGLMMATDPQRAVTGVRRVLRPGGVFVTTTWGGPGENLWMTAVGMAAAMNGLAAGGPPTGPGEPFSLTDAAQLEQVVRDAGFDEVRVEVVHGRRHYGDAAQHVAEIGALAPSLAAAFASATADQVAAVTDQFAVLTAPYAAAGGGVDVPTTALLCVAR